MSESTLSTTLASITKRIVLFITNNLLAVIALVIIMAISLPVGFYGMYLYIEPELPSVDELKKADYKMPLQIYTKDEFLIGEFGGDMSLPVTYNDVPKKLIQAFLAAEDDAFFQHDGISVKGLGRAITETISNSQQQTGGSTITMQVAKNYFLSSDRTIKRKLTEIFLARRLEQNLSKEDILTLYLNKIYLGQNAYGVKAAAKRYYSKSLDHLTTAQMAMIAGMPKAPSKYNPIVNPERAMTRRNWILGRMHALGYINQTDYDEALAEANQLSMYQVSTDKSFPYLAEWARYELVKRFGKDVMNAGWRVKLTVGSKRQELAESALKRGLSAYDRRHGMRAVEATDDKPLSQFHTFDNRWPAKVTKLFKRSFEATLKDGRTITVPWYSKIKWISANRRGYYSSNPSNVFKIGDIVRVRPNKKQTQWSVIQTPVVQGALVALDPETGSLEAMAGGFDFYQSKFNRATQGWRQPGSIIKPFIYTLALEKGYRTNSMVSDEKLRVGSWKPKNADGRYYGKMPLRQALYLSRNLVSIRLLKSVGIGEARQFLSQFGLTKSKLPSNLTLALGTGQVLPIQMATGYAAFANGGHRVQPYFIDSIYDFNGNLVYLANPPRSCAVCYNEKLELEQKQSKKKRLKNNRLSAAQKKRIEAQRKLDDEPYSTNAGPEADRLYEFNHVKLAASQAPRIISPNVAYDMASILKDVVTRGTGKKAMRIGRSDIGGKTGTTNLAKDAWFAGFQPSLVAVAWVGFDIPSTLGKKEYGGVAALPIWTRFMGPALRGVPHQWVTTRNVSKSRKQQSKVIDKSKETDEQAENNVVQTHFEMPPTAYFIQKPRPRPVAPKTYKPKRTIVTPQNPQTGESTASLDSMYGSNNVWINEDVMIDTAPTTPYNSGSADSQTTRNAPVQNDVDDLNERPSQPHSVEPDSKIVVQEKPSKSDDIPLNPAPSPSMPRMTDEASQPIDKQTKSSEPTQLPPADNRTDEASPPKPKAEPRQPEPAAEPAPKPIEPVKEVGISDSQADAIMQ